MRRSCGIVVVVVVALTILLTATVQAAVTYTMPGVPKTTTARSCKEILCEVGCERVTGSNGCPTCICPRTCKNVSCDYGYVCEMQTVQCVTTPCFPQPTCVPAPHSTTPCPLIKCAPGCEPVRGRNGCSKCACPPTCANVTCDYGNVCELREVQCFTTPCFPQPFCVPVSQTTTPCPMVTCAPGCEPVRGRNGCSECACPPTCAAVLCFVGYVCVLREVHCPTTPCFPQPTCVPISQTTTPCPMVTCAPGCEPVKGRNGCSECACPPTCAAVLCLVEYVCVLREVHCPTTPCFPQPTCVPISQSTTPCPLVTCAPGCEHVVGLKCAVCACPPTCENVTCDYGYVCELQEVQCITTPCFPQPTCVPVSHTTTTPAIPTSSTTRCVSDISCGNGCLKRFDSYRCAYCDCPPTCEVVDCRDGYICQMEPMPCLIPPCPTRPVCVPMDSCTGTPNTKRCNRFTASLFWFYNSSANACQKFRYYGCTPSPNTFESRKACEDTCKRRDPPICILIACADDCYTLRRKNKCPKCICPNPCKNFNCSEGQVCKLREVTCAAKSCKHEPYCEPKPCPTQPLCGIYMRCMNGLKTDENGCQLCECL